jgi:hypothetical protein
MAFKQLPTVHTGRPAPFTLTAPAYLAATAGWLAAAIAFVFAADDLAAGAIWQPSVVLVTHLVALAVLPCVVAAAVWQLLPMMLRNDPPHPGRRPLVLALLLAGGPLAAGIALGAGWLIAVAATLLGAGLLLLLAELVALVRRSPRGKQIPVSRSAVVLAAAHAVLAFALGAAVAADGGPKPLGIGFERVLLIHLSLALIGWLTILIAVVGRTLVPMLGLVAAPPRRTRPLSELGVAAGLWTYLGGLASGTDAAVAAGIVVMLVSFAPTARTFARAVLGKKVGLREGQTGHVAVGLVMLAQAAVLGLLAAIGSVEPRRAAIACIVLLGLGWAVGVVVGHLGKLASLSAWGSWPPGPRPKQGALYPRRIWQAELLLFAVAVELLAGGVLAQSPGLALVGAALLVAAAVAAALGTAVTARRCVVGLRAGR